MWRDDIFFYSSRGLKQISQNYFTSYFGMGQNESQGYAEARADFDRALQALGKGKWRGHLAGDGKDYKFRHYRSYSRLQQVVIADILGITDYELESLGIYRIPQLRGYAYHLMKKYLNKER